MEKMRGFFAVFLDLVFIFAAIGIKIGKIVQKAKAREMNKTRKFMDIDINIVYNFGIYANLTSVYQCGTICI